jgi:hypothetical protein
MRYCASQTNPEWVTDFMSGMVPWEAADQGNVLQQLGARIWGRFLTKDEVDREERDPNLLPEEQALLKKVDVARGFEQLYRRFSHTPGNTLSLQVRPAPTYCMQQRQQR